MHMNNHGRKQLVGEVVATEEAKSEATFRLLDLDFTTFGVTLLNVIMENQDRFDIAGFTFDLIPEDMLSDSLLSVQATYTDNATGMAKTFKITIEQ